MVVDKPHFGEDEILRGHCRECQGVCYVKTNSGKMICPHCAGKEVDWEWGNFQTIFRKEISKMNGKDDNEITLTDNVKLEDQDE